MLVEESFARLKSAASAPAFAHFDHRLRRLRALQRLLSEREEAILAALHQDLGKSAFEGYLTEIALLAEELSYAIKKLRTWMKPRPVPGPLAMFWSASWIVPDPLGTVLIIAPWNYPFQLLVGPLIGALAAGNAAVLKPSELTPHTSALMAALIPEYFAADEVMVVEGGKDETAQLASLPFGRIFFTGSARVGALIMAQAAKNLTPVTLELGGKSPCVILTEKNLDLAVKRVLWGKLLNSGQTCVAPDYVLLKKGLKAQFLARYRFWLAAFYGEGNEDENEAAIHTQDYGRIVSRAHFDRLVRLLDGQNIVCSAGADPERLKLGPVLVDMGRPQDTQGHALMEEEIFGPILPMVEVDSLEDALAFIAQHPKPLAAYAFTDSAREERLFVDTVRAGGLCINDVVVHLSNKHLPFGGVGPSGMGAYHGRHSFDGFSHAKSVMKRAFLWENALRYPPSANKLAWIRKLQRWIT